MKTSKEIILEIILEIINDLDLQFSTVYNAKITKDKFIACWTAYRKEADWKYYGYRNQGSCSEAYSRLFYKRIEKEANKESWKAFILRKYGFKYCSRCEELKSTPNFTISNSMISKLNNICKSCASSNRKENSAMYAAHCGKRRASKLKRTPNWLTEDESWLIKEVYSLAKEREKCTGIKWHVDHIIPLRGKLVSGLHIPQNLQVITDYDNVSKGNKYKISGEK